LIGPVGMKKRCQKGTPHSPPDPPMHMQMLEDPSAASVELRDIQSPTMIESCQKRHPVLQAALRMQTLV
jgi:hypothetical protein